MSCKHNKSIYVCASTSIYKILLCKHNKSKYPEWKPFSTHPMDSQTQRLPQTQGYESNGSSRTSHSLYSRECHGRGPHSKYMISQEQSECFHRPCSFPESHGDYSLPVFAVPFFPRLLRRCTIGQYAVVSRCAKHKSKGHTC